MINGRQGTTWRLYRLLEAELGLGAVVAALRLLERVALIAATLEFVRASRARALEGVLALVVTMALRALATILLARRVRSTMVAHALRGVLSGDVLRGSVLPDEDALLGILQGVQSGAWIASEVLPGLLADGVAAGGVGVAVVALAPARVVLMGGAALLIAMVGVIAARRLTASLNRSAESAFLPVGEALSTAFGARLEIVAAGRDATFAREAQQYVELWCREAARGERLASIAGRLPLLGAMAVVALAAVLDQAVQGALSAAALGQAALVASMVPAFAGVSRSAFDLVRTETQLRPLMGLVDAPLGPVGAPRGTQLPPLPADVECRAVSFAYPSAGRPCKRAVSDVHLLWEKRTALVLKGPNGSGKTTLLRLLLGLARPTQGAITVGGRDLFDLDLVAWRNRVAFVPQRPFVPERGTIRQFVRILAPDATDETIERSVARVDLARSIRRIAPEAPLEARASSLSAGERQRLALARALCRDVSVYVLDEPDANLDSAGVILVARLVRELAEHRMVIVAAHSEEILAVADQVVDLATGSVTAPRREDNPRSSVRA